MISIGEGQRVRIIKDVDYDEDDQPEYVGLIGYTIESEDGDGDYPWHVRLVDEDEPIEKRYADQCRRDGESPYQSFADYELELAPYRLSDFADCIARLNEQMHQAWAIPQRVVMGPGAMLVAGYAGPFDGAELQVPRETEKPRLYISAPITGQPEHNFPALNAAAEKYKAMGFDVFNPADTGVIDGWSWSDYLRYDLSQLVKCHGIVLLEGWGDSEGAKLERRTARDLGMFVIYDEDCK